MTREERWILDEKYGGNVTGAESEAFRADCERLKSGEPTAYIIGSIPFLHTKIYLDSRPLIPRPETEFWVEKAIEHITHMTPQAPRVLDLCAGSGAIGVAVAKAIPDAHITFGEIDSTHMDTIKKNIRENLIIYDKILNSSDNIISKNRFTLVVSDLFEHITGTFDFILSNPPYIDKDAHTVEQSVSNFEPHKALFGGRFGIELIETIIAKAPAYLTVRGELWLEHEPAQTAAIAALAQQHGLTATVHNDQYNVARYSDLRVSQ